VGVFRGEEESRFRAAVDSLADTSFLLARSVNCVLYKIF
jgi:hypothetical protein